MNLLIDFSYALRLLRKSPAHTLLCVGVVALSVGLSLASYSTLYNTAFKPMGFKGSENWYVINEVKQVERLSLDMYTYQEIVKRRPGVEHLGALKMAQAVLSEGEASVSLSRGEITPI